MATSRSVPISVLLLEGEQFYKEKKYNLAAQAFTKALNSSKLSDRSDRIHILDLRIGTYVKNKQFDLALKDAKEMVRQERTDGRGYLRCGQLLRLNEDYPAAIKWYQQALKNISSTDRLRSHAELQLIKTRELIGSKLVFSKPTDPMVTLPLELVELIISYFEYKQLVGILRVSKSWKKVLTRLPPLSDTVDFCHANKKINYLMLSASLKRLSKYPKRLVLANFNDAGAKSMKDRLDSWIHYRSLEHLEIYDGKFILEGLRLENFNLQSIVIGPENSVRLLQTQSILEKCPKLRIARFRNISSKGYPDKANYFIWDNDVPHTNLEELEMICSDRGYIHLSAHCFKGFPNLTKLVCRRALVGIGNDENEAELDLSTSPFLSHIDLSDSLVYIKKLPDALSVFRAMKFRTPTHFSWLRKLKVLDLYDCSDPPRLNTATNNGEGNLEEFSITFDQFPDGYPQTFFESITRYRCLANLRLLRLKYYRLYDTFATHFINSMPKLEKMVLENASITGVFLVDLLSVPSCRLQHIVLRDCQKISSDTIDWARCRGFRVDVCNTSAQELGGRMIRT